MDVAVQLAADDRPRFENLRGISEIQFLSSRSCTASSSRRATTSSGPGLLPSTTCRRRRGGLPDDRLLRLEERGHRLGAEHQRGQASKLMARAKKQLTAATGVPVEELRRASST